MAVCVLFANEGCLKDVYTKKGQSKVMKISSTLVGGGLLLNPTTSSHLTAIRREGVIIFNMNVSFTPMRR